MINTKRPNTDDYTQVGFIEAEDNQNNYQNIDHIYDSEGNIVFQQGYLNEYDGADDFGISAIGKPLIDYTIYGNTEQIGIPEPNEPIYPEGCGEQTNNLVPPLSEWVDGFIQIDGTLEEQTENFEKTSGMIPVKPNIKYTFAHESGSFPDGENGPRSVIAQYDNTGKYINQEAWTYKNPYPYTPSDNVGYVRLYFNTYNQPGNIMFNIGPEALPYEPYGYKIPIMAGKYEFLEEPLRAVKNYKDTIDLSTKLLSRQIKELVLTGEETIYKYEYSGTIGFSVNNVLDANYNRTRGMCTHYTVVTGAYKNSLWIGVNNKHLYFTGIGDVLGITEAADFKAYLTQQYAAGTPVTIWYALAEPIVTTLSSIPDGLRGIIEGKGSQLSTPSPSNPIEPIFYGDKMENLFDTATSINGLISDNGDVISNFAYSTSNYIRIDAEFTISLISIYTPSPRIIRCGYYTGSKEHIANADSVSFRDGYKMLQFSPPNGTKFIRFSFISREGYADTQLMLNLGSAPLPYEPYGYKIPISLNQQSIILDESLKAIGNYKDILDLSTGLLTRKIRKLVLDGTEDWAATTMAANDLIFRYELSGLPLVGIAPISTHYKGSAAIRWVNVEDYSVTTSIINSVAIRAKSGYTSVDDFKSYLAAQYAAGTPVTVWYVLAEPTTETISIPSGLTGTIEGVGIQNGTPTPDNPIMPVGKGKRTGNVMPAGEEKTVVSNGITFNSDGKGKYSISGTATAYASARFNLLSPFTTPISVSNGGQGTLSFFNTQADNHVTFIFYNGTTKLDDWKQTPSNRAITAYNAIGNKYVNRIAITVSSGATVDITITPEFTNDGILPSEFEPYGYKIPISSANTTTPVYLGEVETTRQVKKLVLDGTENWVLEYTDNFLLNTPIVDAEPLQLVVCTHQQSISTGYEPNTNFENVRISQTKKLNFRTCTIPHSLSDFKSFLAAQYAAGTPVTVWYVLATPETAVVNEPLMKIGGYADSVDFSQAGVDIPTLKRPNTTVIDITTSLPPSEVYAKYRGSKTQKYDLFLAANGDSFEAKNGQSLYIGDDT